MYKTYASTYHNKYHLKKQRSGSIPYVHAPANPNTSSSVLSERERKKDYLSRNFVEDNRIGIKRCGVHNKSVASRGNKRFYTLTFSRTSELVLICLDREKGATI